MKDKFINKRNGLAIGVALGYFIGVLSVNQFLVCFLV